MDLIANLNPTSSTQWVFLSFLIILAYITIVKFYFSNQFSLILRSSYSKKFSNQYLRDETNSKYKLYLLPVFILSLSLFLSFQDPSLIFFVKCIFWISFYLVIKYFILIFLANIFEKQYLYEEIIFQSFLYEKVVGVVLFPLTMVLFYGSIKADFIVKFITIFLIFSLLYKWLRILYLSFFNSSLSKAHIIIYLCTFEILPITVIIKHLY
tara:strand:- start:7569 stop:8198 length:630 start_codon:yes stop_codon:yes gene_type:complete